MSVCKYCGKQFTKTHNRQMYCSSQCKTFATREQKAAYQRRRRKLINSGILISNETQKLGTGYLSCHRRQDFTDEHNSILKEIQRIGC